ncbi:secreted protein [Beggiatoa sp. PS]|nr:secreted protein [Beggiatoa sp. PS]
MLLSKSQLKHPPVDSPPGKKVLYGSASIMLAFMIGAAPYAQAQNEDSQGTIQFTEGKYEVPEMSGKAVLCVERRGGD